VDGALSSHADRRRPPQGCTKTPESLYGIDQNGCTKTSGIRTQEEHDPIAVDLGHVERRAT